MLKNFERYTQNPGPYEEKALPVIVQMLNDSSSERPVKNHQIRRVLRQWHGLRISDSEIRMLIHSIRRQGRVLCVVASQRGYWKTTSETEMAEYLESLSQRVSSINEIRRCLKRQQQECFGRDLDEENA